MKEKKKVADKSKAFRQWQERMGFTRHNVSVSLGISINTVAGYRTGRRSDGEVEVPKHILLACAAVEAGLSPVTMRRD